MSALVKYIIKHIEDPFKPAAALTLHGASLGNPCKDLDCDGIYNQSISTHKRKKINSVKNALFPQKRTPPFSPHTH